MILYIAEKPSLGRAVARALPKPHKNGDGFITLGNGDIVSWCIGHLLEQAKPEVYRPEYKKWDIKHLPIIPTTWQLEVKQPTKKQLILLKKLIKKADTLVNIGDPDREGQLLVDEVINYAGASKNKIASARRCLINDLNPESVKKSLKNLRNNTDFIPLATSALARVRADWLYGINMTRLCTKRGQQFGFNGVLSIGRVQTPLLGLVVKRDLAIENFVSKPFYELEISLKTNQGFTFMAKWKPGESCNPYMDDENRILSRKLIEDIASQVCNKTGQITHLVDKQKTQPPPLPYNLSALQIDAAKIFHLSAKQVLECCQGLYEKHKLITYPRSDSRYLPAEHFAEAPKVIAAVCTTDPNLANLVKLVDPLKKSGAWNNKKIEAHHAIIPTQKKAPSASLSSTEKKVYNLIARQYLMQFLPQLRYRQIKIDSIIENKLFTTRREKVITLGWKAALPGNGSAKDNGVPQNEIPPLKKGETVTCYKTQIHDKNTTPPKYFNDASLLSAMTGIARFVTEPTIKKILRETDGIGTEATRASIIELLFKRDFLIRQGKAIRSTEVGRQLIQALPDCVVTPDMTAQWESQLAAISQRQLRYDNFMAPMVTTLTKLIHQVSQVSFDGLRDKSSKKHKNAVTKKNRQHKQDTFSAFSRKN